MARDGSGWLGMARDGSGWLGMARDGSRWLEMARDGSGWLGMHRRYQDGHARYSTARGPAVSVARPRRVP
eukprot:6191841-Prymnesium_polylepis.1